MILLYFLFFTSITADVQILLSESLNIYNYPNTVGDFSAPFSVISGILQTTNPIGACYPIDFIASDNVICLVQRDEECSFTEKTIYAQLGGCSAIIIYDNIDEGLISMDGNDEYINIPSVFISLDSYDSINQLMSYQSSNLSITINNVQYFTIYIVTIIVFIVCAIILFVIILTCISSSRYQRYQRYQKHKNIKTYNTISDFNVTYKVMKNTDDTESVSSVNNFSKSTCSICTFNYKKGEINRKLICGHNFHKPCIDPWLIINSTCPLCRANI